MSRRLLFCIVIVLFGIALAISGCQSDEVKDQDGTSTQEVPSIPYSHGPTSPPYVRGPTGPPPSATVPTDSDNSDSNAITETETVRYSLPEDPDIKVKQ